MRLLRVLATLLILGLLGLAGYAYLGDMAADPTEMRVPVELQLQAPDAGTAVTPNAPVTAPATGAATDAVADDATDDAGNATEGEADSAPAGASDDID